MSLETTAEDALDALCGPADGPLAAAVSGGSDSMALMTLAAGWAKRRGRSVHVLTLDHGLRPEAAMETRFVARRAAETGLTCGVLKWDAPRPNQRLARRARHALLAQAARDAGAVRLLAGHTRDDQAETFFMRASRGSGWRGLAGIAPLSVSPVWPEGRGVVLARPLLGLSRAALRDWLAARGEAWIEDPSNFDDRYERVRWRAWLRDRPKIADRGADLASRLARLRAFEGARLAAWAGDHVTARADGAVSARLDELHAGLRAPALSMLLQIAAGADAPPDASGLGALLEDIADGGPRAARTFAGAWIRRDPGAVVLARDPGLADPAAPLVCQVWDGRFLADPAAPPIEDAHQMARPTLPDGPGWRALAQERLEIWRRALTAC